MDIPQNVLEQVNTSKFDKAPKYEIASKVAYLLGLSKDKYLKNGYLPDIFDKLESDKNAKIIRYLCMLRTLSFLNSKYIYNRLTKDNVAVYAINDIYPTEIFSFLESQNIRFSEKTHHNIVQFEIEINQFIQGRINSITNLFTWIKSEYIREMFIMPNGTNVESMKEEIEKYYQNQAFYPFKLYLNWPAKQTGNLLKNDMTFCWNIYDWHDERFTDINKATDISQTKKEEFYNFVRKYRKILFIVDCENTDVYRLFAALEGLEEEYINKIYKMILVDDPNTTKTWKKLANYVKIPLIEYNEVNRVLGYKSLVDGTVMMNIQHEYDVNDVDGVIIASSDSDYWAVKLNIKNIGLFVMTQQDRSSQEYLEKLSNNNIDFCHIDEFSSQNSDNLIREAFENELERLMNEKVGININQLMYDVLHNIYAELNDQEKKNYIERYIRNMKFVIENEELRVKV